MRKPEPELTDAEIEQRMRETVRRSFEIPHKMQKEMVGKVGRKAKTRPASKGRDRKGKSRS
ncbi:MAG TPA: hypothetical protein VH020_11590 [Stellaceae bacterium]|jgi:hypothetical protein|nr:hypothetical protein [Stellaceae bacterium]